MIIKFPVRLWALPSLLFNGYRQHSSKGTVTLTTHLQQVPILRMSLVIITIPPICLHSLQGAALNLLPAILPIFISYS